MLKYWSIPEHDTIGLVPCQGQPAITCVSCPTGWHLAGLQRGQPQEEEILQDDQVL